MLLLGLRTRERLVGTRVIARCVGTAFDWSRVSTRAPPHPVDAPHQDRPTPLMPRLRTSSRHSQHIVHLGADRQWRP
jgi:hypothetical protein